MPDKFRSLKDVFNTEPQLKNVRRIIKSSDVIIDFAKIFPDLIIIAVPLKVDNLFLKLRVENSVWRSELKFSEKEIVEKINKYYNEERIKGIKFTN
jgi:hypothetical protein